MSPENCRLCGKAAELQNSHILPAFVYKWLKETSATGYLRVNQAPNRRVQDGISCPWLCMDCEKLLNGWETQFANKLFHPLNHDGSQSIPYADWLLKFCVSVSWRSLLWMRENGALRELNTVQIDDVARALEVWKAVLLGKAPHPGRHEQHFLPLDSIESSTLPSVPPNINRYTLRTVAVDVVRSDSTLFVYTKLGKFLVLGFINVAIPKQWKGTKVHVARGVTGKGEFTLPPQFADYLFGKALQLADMHAAYSDAQRDKIEGSARKNIARVLGSGSLLAMQSDIDLSGPAAFEIHAPRDDK